LAVINLEIILGGIAFAAGIFVIFYASLLF